MDVDSEKWVAAGAKIGGCADGPSAVSFRPLDSLFRGQTVADFCLSSGGSEIRWNSSSTRRNSTREAVATASSRGNTRLKEGIHAKLRPRIHLAAQVGSEPQTFTPLGWLCTFFPHPAHRRRSVSDGRAVLPVCPSGTGKSLPFRLWPRGVEGSAAPTPKKACPALRTLPPWGKRTRNRSRTAWIHTASPSAEAPAESGISISVVTGLTRSAKQHETSDACSTTEPSL